MPEIPNREKRSFRLDLNMETRKADDGTMVMTGHAAVFDEWADIGWFQERIAKGAFKDSIKEDDIRAVFNHDPNFVLGRNKAGTLRLSEDDKGLAVEIVPPDTQFAKDLTVLMERGDITQMSFAFQTLEDEWDYGDEKEPDRRTLKKVRLFDVSPVTYPAYEGTDIAVASRDKGRADKEAIESKAKAERLHTFKLRQKLHEKEEVI